MPNTFMLKTKKMHINCIYMISRQRWKKTKQWKKNYKVQKWEKKQLNKK